MILGVPITGPMVAAAGLALWLAIVFQVLVGLHYIKLGRHHRVIHKWVGISIAVAAVLHGLVGATFALGWTIL
jgi:hypothetical protein